MADITEAQRQRIAAAIAKALATEQSPTRATAVRATAVDSKEFFCGNWVTIKSGLVVLQTFVPTYVRAIIAVVIAAGDAAKGVVCPSKK